MQNELSPDVADIVEKLARQARGYNNHLKWNEQAMFKADLMNCPGRWKSVDSSLFSVLCREHGMRDQDVNLLVEWLVKMQGGRRLVPHRRYRDYTFFPRQ